MYILEMNINDNNNHTNKKNASKKVESIPNVMLKELCIHNNLFFNMETNHLMSL